MTLLLVQMTTNIEAYYQYLLEHPKRANKKILSVYKKLVNDIHNKKVVEYINKESGEVETKTYVFNQTKASRPIYFIEHFCKHSRVNGLVNQSN